MTNTLDQDPCAPALSVRFRPTAGVLTPMRQFVSSFCETFVGDPDTVFRIALSVHELVENAIKYSLDGTALVQIELRSEADGPRLSIRTENRATREAIAAVRDAIVRIHSAEDPFGFYCDLVRASAERDEGSGLGLARIRAEGGLEIDSLAADDHVFVLAAARIERGALL